MVQIAQNRTGRIIPDDLDRIIRLYREALKLIVARNSNGSSVRSISEKMEISHVTILRLIKNPDKIPTRKMMIKIIKGKLKAQKSELGKRDIVISDILFTCAK